MDTKTIRGRITGEWNIYIVSKYHPTEYLLITKEYLYNEKKNPIDIILTKWSNLIFQTKIHWHHELFALRLCVMYVAVLPAVLFTWI